MRSAHLQASVMPKRARAAPQLQTPQRCKSALPASRSACCFAVQQHHLLPHAQVKREDGQQTYVIRLRAEDTIGTLRAALSRHRGADCGFQICSAFPPRQYVDAGETLAQAQLVPNGTLFLRARAT